MGEQSRPLAVVTGASTGIGFELAKCCARAGYELIIAADEPGIHQAKDVLSANARVQAIQADLSTLEGVDKLYAAAQGRPIAALLANAGRGLGRGFLDQDFGEVRRLIDTNVTGTLYLIQRVARDMVARKTGRILITGSVAGFMPGTFQAVYNGTKAMIDSFSYALREELQGTGVSVTCLMPGPTDTRFFERADMLDTKVGTQEKQPAHEVAELGFSAMQRGDAHVITGWRNKIMATLAHFAPAQQVAKQHRKMAAPGSATHS